MKAKIALCALLLVNAYVVAHQADPAVASSRQLTKFDLQGHRGARGLLPENTIPAFLRALDLGVNTLEMDVVINAQGNVFLSHEPWMSATICSYPDGRIVRPEESKRLNIYKMSDEEVRGFDCGSRGHRGFPRQQAMRVSKPLLHEVFDAVSLRTKETGREPVRFNIEIKSRAEHDGVFHPAVEEYARVLIMVLQQHDVIGRTSIQSFDPRALESAHRIDPEISLVLLVENELSFQENINRLSFKPDIYSPHHARVNEVLIEAARANEIRVIPWTVNDEQTMRKLITLGVDGLITDYPDLGLSVLASIERDP